MTMPPDSAPLRFAAALSTEEDTQAAAKEASDRASAQLGGPADLAVVFISAHHAERAEELAQAICDRIGTEQLIGGTGEAIVGTGREVEDRPAVSLWLARLPGASVRTFSLSLQRTPEGGSFAGFPEDLPEAWLPGSALLLVGEPYSFPADALLERLNEDQPRVPVLGGMASGGNGPGQNRLFWGRRALDEGAVAALISGPVRVRAVVSQGCRPIGRPLVITKAERNIIAELGGRPALAQLQELFQSLLTREQELVQSGLHVGRVVSEYQDRFEAGDFLVRNVLGFDPKTGAIAIGDYVRPGQTVQFHVRDAQTADDDLRQLLAAVRDAGGSAPAGALLFTCNGRGTRLFPGPDHDASCVRDVLGEIPVAGFFAQGELGPVGGQNFMHGFTASVALFERPG